MKFINDIPNVQGDEYTLKVYRIWRNIQYKLNPNNIRYQEGITICPSWYLLSNLMEDLTTLSNYQQFKYNPKGFKCLLKEGCHHYNINNIILYKIPLKSNIEPYNVSVEEYNKLFKQFKSKYPKYKSYINESDYQEVINYAIGKATTTFNPNKNTLFTTFAYKVISNTILEHINNIQKNLKRYISLDYILDDEGIPFKIESLLLDTNDTSNIVYTLKEYKNNIAYLDKNILNLLLDGYTQKEISKVLNISTSKISRVVSKLRYDLKQLI